MTKTVIYRKEGKAELLEVRRAERQKGPKSLWDNRSRMKESTEGRSLKTWKRCSVPVPKRSEYHLPELHRGCRTDFIPGVTSNSLE